MEMARGDIANEEAFVGAPVWGDQKILQVAFALVDFGLEGSCFFDSVDSDGSDLVDVFADLFDSRSGNSVLVRGIFGICRTGL